MLDLDRLSKQLPVTAKAPTPLLAVPPTASSAAATATASASNAGAAAGAVASPKPASELKGAGGLSASDVEGMVQHILAVTSARSASGSASASAAAASSGVSRDAALQALVQSEYDLLNALCAVMGDDAATRELEAQVNSQLTQTIEAQTKYSDGSGQSPLL
jgi:hypothetical protein